MTEAELSQMTDDDLQLWKDELPVAEFRALLRERDEAQEAAETYHAAWLNERDRWKEREEATIAAFEYREDVLSDRLGAANDRLREALRTFGQHLPHCGRAHYEGDLVPCRCGLADIIS